MSATVSARSVSPPSESTRFVSCDGARVTVPATWPVIDLQERRVSLRPDRAT
jgi:hypothetical protein